MLPSVVGLAKKKKNSMPRTRKSKLTQPGMGLHANLVEVLSRKGESEGLQVLNPNLAAATKIN